MCGIAGIDIENNAGGIRLTGGVPSTRLLRLTSTRKSSASFLGRWSQPIRRPPAEPNVPHLPGIDLRAT